MIETKLDFDKALDKSQNNKTDTDCNLFYDLGDVYNNGFSDNSVEINYVEAYYWYGRASEQGHLCASVRLADLLSEGVGCDKDIEKSIEIYKQCIDKKSSIAASNLGIVYRDMFKYEEAFEFYEISECLMSKDCNRPVATLNVALCYLYGIGVGKDVSKAIGQLSQLINDQNYGYTCVFEIQEAAYILGTIYLSQDNEDSIDKARRYLLIANEDEDHNSAQELLNIIGRG